MPPKKVSDGCGHVHTCIVPSNSSITRVKSVAGYWSDEQDNENEVPALWRCFLSLGQVDKWPKLTTWEKRNTGLFRSAWDYVASQQLFFFFFKYYFIIQAKSGVMRNPVGRNHPPLFSEKRKMGPKQIKPNKCLRNRLISTWSAAPADSAAAGLDWLIADTWQHLRLPHPTTCIMLLLSKMVIWLQTWLVNPTWTKLVLRDWQTTFQPWIQSQRRSLCQQQSSACASQASHTTEVIAHGWPPDWRSRRNAVFCQRVQTSTSWRVCGISLDVPHGLLQQLKEQPATSLMLGGIGSASCCQLLHQLDQELSPPVSQKTGATA